MVYCSIQRKKVTLTKECVYLLMTLKHRYMLYDKAGLLAQKTAMPELFKEVFHAFFAPLFP